MSKIKQINENEVHVLKADGKFTACGFDTTKNPENWEKFRIQVKLLVLKTDANKAKIEYLLILKGICYLNAGAF